MHVDTLIIGSGLAGSALSLLLSEQNTSKMAIVRGLPATTSFTWGLFADSAMTFSFGSQPHSPPKEEQDFLRNWKQHGKIWNLFARLQENWVKHSRLPLPYLASSGGLVWCSSALQSIYDGNLIDFLGQSEKKIGLVHFSPNQNWLPKASLCNEYWGNCFHDLFPNIPELEKQCVFELATILHSNEIIDKIASFCNRHSDIELFLFPPVFGVKNDRPYQKLVSQMEQRVGEIIPNSEKSTIGSRVQKKLNDFRKYFATTEMEGWVTSFETESSRMKSVEITWTEDGKKQTKTVTAHQFVFATGGALGDINLLEQHLLPRSLPSWAKNISSLKSPFVNRNAQGNPLFAEKGVAVNHQFQIVNSFGKPWLENVFAVGDLVSHSTEEPRSISDSLCFSFAKTTGRSLLQCETLVQQWEKSKE